jgi:peptidoglycan/LPS O-acetylase OafA/YrhL
MAFPVGRRIVTNNPALDGLRALAILLVFLFHARVPGFPAGFVGVDLFFVLSGYLITSLLQQEIARAGSVSLVSFYRSRALRLWPPLLPMLGAYLAVAPSLWPELDPLGDVLLAGLYLTDFSYPWFGRPDILNHTWSLAVEAQFYLLWPFAVTFLARLERRKAMTFLACLFLVATLWRWNAALGGAAWHFLYYCFDMRISGLVLGTFVAFAAFEPSRRSAGILGGVALLVLAVLAMCPLWRTPESIMLQPAVDLASAGLVAVLASRQSAFLTTIFSARPLVHLGLLSYSLYLWHYPIVRALRFSGDWIVVALAGAMLSLILAQLSYTLLESPLRRYRHGSRKNTEPASTCGSRAVA